MQRICPGRFLAEDIGYCIVTALLWGFSMKQIDRSASQEEVRWVDSAIRQADFVRSLRMSPLTPLKSTTPVQGCVPTKIRKGSRSSQQPIRIGENSRSTSPISGSRLQGSAFHCTLYRYLTQEHKETVANYMKRKPLPSGCIVLTDHPSISMIISRPAIFTFLMGRKYCGDSMNRSSCVFLLGRGPQVAIDCAVVGTQKNEEPADTVMVYSTQSHLYFVC